MTDCRPSPARGRHRHGARRRPSARCENLVGPESAAHASNVSATSFYWLRQLRRVRRSLDSESAATLVHAFVTSRVDQCNAVLAGATKSVTDTLQRVMNAAARVVTDTRKFDHGLIQILHDDLHWLDVADRVTYKLGVIMHRCRHGNVDCCTQVTDVVGRQRLRSATATNGGATTSAIHCWTPSIHCAWPHGLELLAGRPP